MEFLEHFRYLINVDIPIHMNVSTVHDIVVT